MINDACTNIQNIADTISYISPPTKIFRVYHNEEVVQKNSLISKQYSEYVVPHQRHS